MIPPLAKRTSSWFSCLRDVSVCAYSQVRGLNAPQQLLRALLHGLQIGEVEADESGLLPRKVLELPDDRLRALLVAAEHVHRRVALQEHLRDLLPDACIEVA